MPEDHRRDADAEGRAEAVARLRGDIHDPEDEKEVEPEENDAAGEPPLLGPDGEREIGPVLGKEVELVLRAVEVALAAEAPGADGEDRLPRVPAGARRIRRG